MQNIDDIYMCQLNAKNGHPKSKVLNGYSFLWQTGYWP